MKNTKLLFDEDGMLIPQQISYKITHGPESSGSIKTLIREKEILSSNNFGYGTCEECMGPIIRDYRRGHCVCTQCGLIPENFIIFHNDFETRMFTREDQIRKSHYGPFLFSHNLGLHFYNRKTLKEVQTLREVRMVSNPNRNREDRMKRKLYEGFYELGVISYDQHYRIPKFAKGWTFSVYTRLLKQRRFKRKSAALAIAGCLGYVCERANLLISPQKIIDKSNYSEKQIRRATLLTKQYLQLKDPTDPLVWVSLFIKELGLDNTFEKKVIIFLGRIPDSFIKGDIRLFCAANIYLVGRLEHLNLTKDTIMQKLGVSTHFITKYRELKAYLNISIKPLVNCKKIIAEYVFYHPKITFRELCKVLVDNKKEIKRKCFRINIKKLIDEKHVIAHGQRIFNGKSYPDVFEFNIEVMNLYPELKVQA